MERALVAGLEDGTCLLYTSLLPWKLDTNILGMNFGSYDIYLWICSGVVLLYVLKGGLTSAIYTEVLQFFMIVLGFAPVVYLGLQDAGGWHTMNHALQGAVSYTHLCCRGNWTRTFWE